MATIPQKVSEKPKITAAFANDYMLVVHDPTGINQTSIITVQNYFANVAVPAVFTANVIVKPAAVLTANTVSITNLFVNNFTTPVTSGDVVAKGAIWADSNYIYVAVANNTIKRASLSSF